MINENKSFRLLNSGVIFAEEVNGTSGDTVMPTYTNACTKLVSFRRDITWKNM